LLFKTVDSIDEDQLSAPSSNTGDGADVGIAEDSHAPSDALSADHVEDRNDWASATRTLGSLFLRQEDADRNRDVDVFGRPLLTNETEDKDSSPFSLQETSFAKYLMSLKHQEEDNRERAAATGQNEPKSVVNDRRSSNEKSSDLQIDQKTAKELDESVSIVSEDPVKDMKVFPSDDIEAPSKESGKQPITREDMLRLSYPEHYNDRIGRDKRHLAVSIAASIDKPWQWKLFFDEGGGVMPLLECIRDGARSVEQGGVDFLDDLDFEGTNGLTEQHEASFAAACTACRALRDLSALSKDFAAVVTDDILKVDSQWSTCVVQQGSGFDCSSGGLISDLLTLLKHANEAEAFYKAPLRANRGSRRASFSIRKRRQRRDARQRCGLYVIQLLLSMAVASDEAVSKLRSTSGLIEEVVECSSFAPSERFKRKWVRKPVRAVKRMFRGRRKEVLKKDYWVEPGLTGKVQQNSNKLLAAIGHNEWYPKLRGQRGLRVLCLDGGGTRGIAAVTSLRHLVKAMGGVEVCDAFDMIVGTSTGGNRLSRSLSSTSIQHGHNMTYVLSLHFLSTFSSTAIVAFLVGLRRESAADARIRYDTLIKRIFVKSLLKPIMLATTTASYDEANLMEVLEEILKDDGMLDSRANPAVPLITAVSSKMSSTPTQLCLLRNYNYGGGEMPDSFCIDPMKARQRLGLEHDDVMENYQYNPKQQAPIKCAPRTGKGSRYPGSFRVTQKIALRATTAAPTFFKPLLSFDELYCDGGIVASNPSAVAVHEARAAYPGVPLELVVSVGTGKFNEVKVPPRVGWDGVVAQILDSATDAEGVHHVLEDVFGEEKTAQHTGTRMASTTYFRFNPIVGDPNSFPIDEIDPGRLQDLCDIVDVYMEEEEQQAKLQQLGEIIHPKSWIQRAIRCSKEKHL
jgi:hypothetical protein